MIHVAAVHCCTEVQRYPSTNQSCSLLCMTHVHATLFMLRVHASCPCFLSMPLSPVIGTHSPSISAHSPTVSTRSPTVPTKQLVLNHQSFPPSLSAASIQYVQDPINPTSPNSYFSQSSVSPHKNITVCHDAHVSRGMPVWSTYFQSSVVVIVALLYVLGASTKAWRGYGTGVWRGSVQRGGVLCCTAVYW